MSKDVNKITLIGRIGATPTIKQLEKSGSVATSLPLYTEHRSRDTAGAATVEKARHNLVVYGKLAEIVCKYAKSGARVYVEGRLRYRTWTDAVTQLERSRPEIVVSEFILQGERRGDASGERDEPGEGDGATVPESRQALG